MTTQEGNYATQEGVNAAKEGNDVAKEGFDAAQEGFVVLIPDQSNESVDRNFAKKEVEQVPGESRENLEQVPKPKRKFVGEQETSKKKRLTLKVKDFALEKNRQVKVFLKVC